LRHQIDRHVPSHDRWLLSYADFVTLLLALFVVLYAVSAVDAQRLQELAHGVRSAFESPGSRGSGILEGMGPSRAGPNTLGRPTTLPAAKTEFLVLRDRLATSMNPKDGEEGAGPGVELRKTERGLIISLSSADFFPAGDIEMSESGLRTLDAISAVLALESAPLRVEGHTDDRPIETGLFPSNWELSTARASAVVRHLIERHGVAPARVGAAGYAEYRPLVPNDSDENRALNRRIDIVVLASAAVESEEPEADEEMALQRLLDRLPEIEELPSEDPGL